MEELTVSGRDQGLTPGGSAPSTALLPQHQPVHSQLAEERIRPQSVPRGSPLAPPAAGAPTRTHLRCSCALHEFSNLSPRYRVPPCT